MSHPVVFFDIAGPLGAGLPEFYKATLGWEADEGGAFSVAVAGTTLDATLRQDPADKVIYAGVPDINATLDSVTKAGGQIVAPRFEVPGVVVLALFTDPAGNTMGLVEMDGEQPVIP